PSRDPAHDLPHGLVRDLPPSSRDPPVADRAAEWQGCRGPGRRHWLLVVCRASDTAHPKFQLPVEVLHIISFRANATLRLSLGQQPIELVVAFDDSVLHPRGDHAVTGFDRIE